jgi:phospholipase/lecithinase/hemolysin
VRHVFVAANRQAALVVREACPLRNASRFSPLRCAFHGGALLNAQSPAPAVRWRRLRHRRNNPLERTARAGLHRCEQACFFQISARHFAAPFGHPGLTRKTMNTTGKLLRWVLLALALCVAAAGHAAPLSSDVKALYVFGDSLSDTGNDLLLTRSQAIDPAVPPSASPHRTYFEGRFSNGAVAVEHLWRLMERDPRAAVAPFLADKSLDKRGAVNFAFGGAASGDLNGTPGGFVVPGLLGQVKMFSDALAGKKPKHKALYVVWTGSNDYVLGLTNDPQGVVANIVTGIERLYALGARDFLVPNLADLGMTPLVQSQGMGPAFTQLTQAHNALLAQALTGLAARLDRINIIRLDVDRMTRGLVDAGLMVASPPALAFLSPTTIAYKCLFVSTAACPDVDLNAPLPPFLFWDVLHPTAFAHQLLGSAMFIAVRFSLH